jgi:GrpB-like predicted nucleotidyltransferase (UPF0157 family)
VVEYDPAWPALFEALTAPVRDAVAGLGAEVEHVGDVVVRSPDDVPEAIARLGSLGYVHEGDLGIPGREAFLWPPGTTRHHLYVVVAGSPPHRDHVQFRDHLRTHSEAAAEYAELKREVAQLHRADREAYTDAKAAFVARVLTPEAPGSVPSARPRP